MQRPLTYAVAALALLAIVAIGAAVAWKPAMERWVGNSLAEIGGPFELTSHEGRPFTQADLAGHPHIVYFGFTYCPDICPTTLFLLASVMEELGERARDLKVVFVSVDPERDSVDVLAEYVSAFHDNFVGLTGSPQAIDDAAKAYAVFYRKVAIQGGSYTIDHTASARLFDAAGTYVASIAYDATFEDALAAVENLLATAGGG